MTQISSANEVKQDEVKNQNQLEDEDDFELPVCQLRPGQEGFEACESCQ